MSTMSTMSDIMSVFAKLSDRDKQAVLNGAIRDVWNASNDFRSILGLFDASLGARSNATNKRPLRRSKSSAGVAR
jgi:hypothetical protein